MYQPANWQPFQKNLYVTHWIRTVDWGRRGQTETLTLTTPHESWVAWWLGYRMCSKVMHKTTQSSVSSQISSRIRAKHWYRDNLKIGAVVGALLKLREPSFHQAKLRNLEWCTHVSLRYCFYPCMFKVQISCRCACLFLLFREQSLSWCCMTT